MSTPATEASQAYIANVAILRKKTVMESWYNTIWAKWSGNTDISSDANGNVSYRPSGMPIEMFSDFIQQGRDNMLLPMRKRLVGDAVYGDAVLKGTGEDQDLDWLRMYVNQYRKAVMAKSGEMQNQFVKLYNMTESAAPRLRDWLTQYENQEVPRCFYEGLSQNVSRGTNDDGTGVYKRLHPNYYVNSSGSLAELGTAGSTKTAANMTTGLGYTLLGLSSAILQQLNPVMMAKRIDQIVSSKGHPYWAGIISPQQKIALLQDDDFQAANRAAWQGAGTNAELQGLVGHYLGFSFYEDLISVRAYDDTSDSFFGTTQATAFAPSTVTTNHNAIFFGNGAIGKGIAKNGTKFTTELDDHQNTEEVGLSVINGYNRADYFDDAVAGETAGGGAANAFSKGNATAGVINAIAAINQSSLILMTKPTLT